MPVRRALPFPVHFTLIDQVVEADETRLVAVKAVSAGEEYLQDHFPTFPVLPGVLMLEALVQGARALLERRGVADAARHVLGEVRALKYGSFVRPGELLRVELTLRDTPAGGPYGFKGKGIVVRPQAEPAAPAPVAVSGKLSLRLMHPAGR